MVPAADDLGKVDLTLCRVVAGPREGHDTSGVGGHGAGVEAYVLEQGAQTTGGVEHFRRLYKGDPVLSHENAAWFQAALHPGIEGAGEEGFGRAMRVGGVGDDDVEALRALLHKIGRAH